MLLISPCRPCRARYGSVSLSFFQSRQEFKRLQCFRLKQRGKHARSSWCARILWERFRHQDVSINRRHKYLHTCSLYQNPSLGQQESSLVPQSSPLNHPKMADADSVPIQINLKLPQYVFQLGEEELSSLHEEARKSLWEGIEKDGMSSSLVVRDSEYPLITYLL